MIFTGHEISHTLYFANKIWLKVFFSQNNCTEGTVSGNFLLVRNLTSPCKNRKTENSFLSDNWPLKIAYRARKMLSKRHYRMRIWPSNILTKRESGYQIFLPDMIFLVNIFCPDNYSLTEIRNVLKTNVCRCPWPYYNVPAKASGMSLYPQDRRDTRRFYQWENSCLVRIFDRQIFFR